MHTAACECKGQTRCISGFPSGLWGWDMVYVTWPKGQTGVEHKRQSNSNAAQAKVSYQKAEARVADRQSSRGVAHQASLAPGDVETLQIDRPVHPWTHLDLHHAPPVLAIEDSLTGMLGT